MGSLRESILPVTELSLYNNKIKEGKFNKMLKNESQIIIKPSQMNTDLG